MVITKVTIQKRMQEEALLSCPRCKVHMAKLHNGKYIIDVCRKCGGVWLDRKEVNHIQKRGFITHVVDYWRRAI